MGIDIDFLVRLSIAKHPGRNSAIEIRDRHLDRGDVFVITPQVISEFVHVVTDSRRFTKPLTMPKAIALAENWCQADDLEAMFPNHDSITGNAADYTVFSKLRLIEME